MRHIIYILSLLCFFNSCSFRTQDKADKLIEKVEKIDIKRFYPIEFGRRGDLEIYTYHFNDTSNYVWTYNTKKEQFDFDSNPLFDTFTNEIKDYKTYASILREDINTLNIVMISQSPWIGNLIRFWISPTEFVSYVNPDFDFDNAAKQQWKKELKLGKELNTNWIIVDISSKEYKDYYDKNN